MGEGGQPGILEREQVPEKAQGVDPSTSEKVLPGEEQKGSEEPSKQGISSEGAEKIEGETPVNPPFKTEQTAEQEEGQPKASSIQVPDEKLNEWISKLTNLLSVLVSSNAST